MASRKEYAEKKGKKKVMTVLMALVMCTLGGCQETIDGLQRVDTQGKAVPVSLQIGFAEENSSFSPLSGGRRAETRISGAGATAFEARPVSPSVSTKSGATAATPDQLYNLEIYQYRADGSYLASATSLGTIQPGSYVTATLHDNGGEPCQLLIVTRGATAAFGSFGSKSLGEVRKLTASRSVIESADVTTGANINNMPYLLYLPEVKIVSDRIVSPDGRDVRLQLKRLAVALTLDWTLSDAMKTAGYALTEVRLMQVPHDYFILPERETEVDFGEMYPVSVSEFIDGFRLKESDLAAAGAEAGSKTLWLPANARGTRRDVTSALYRDKEHAHSAATYAEFVVDNSGKKERLFYRVYLGGNETTDFNLLENTNYYWKININQANYAADPRIRLFDQTPVVSTNFVPTANCFMMRPGTDLCFNPYQHTSGTQGWNQYLTSDGTLTDAKTISYVRILWQTKDAGTSGDLVMGYVIDETHHENLVNSSELSDTEKARVYVKVPHSKGGNAVIAAYNSSHTIVWSWHLWISDYVPMRIARFDDYASAQVATRSGTVHKYDSPLFAVGGVYAAKVMMDRDLGARAGGFPGITIGGNFSKMDVVNTYGFLYQWGRKDPFFPSLDGTTNEKDVIYDGYGVPKNLAKSKSQTNVEGSIQHPLTYYYNQALNWSNESNSNTYWNAGNNSAPGTKTIYDPCPDGWKVPSIFYQSTATTADNIQTNTLFANFGMTSSGSPVYNSPNGADYTKCLYYYKDAWYGSTPTQVGENSNPKGGRIFLIGNTQLSTMTIYNTAWFPANAERNGSGSFNGELTYAGRLGHIWGADYSSGANRSYLGLQDRLIQVSFYSQSYGWSVRCIQE